MLAALVSGCTSLPPGSDFPRVASTALPRPTETRLGHQFELAAREHEGKSGFRIIQAGVDGFLLRMQMIDAAERTLDLQYYIFRGDETGKLLSDAILRAADRGVRVRLLIDDGDIEAGDYHLNQVNQANVLKLHPNIELRVFNPFAYRGHSTLLRATEFMFNSARLDYRMHNKLLVVDNALALVGGRNVGDPYFQIDPDSQFGDDDVLVAGPVSRALSDTFDAYWNSDLAIPIEALSGKKSSHHELITHPGNSSESSAKMEVDGQEYLKRVASGEPYRGIISGRLPLIWAHAQVVCDSPDKRKVEAGAKFGQLIQEAVTNTAAGVQSELLIVSPYLIPGKEGMKLLKDLRRRNVHVRILTNSLESSNVLLAQSGYMRYRVPLLKSGVDLYEIRSHLGSERGSGQSKQLLRYGNYALHAKLFVFDRKKVFIGSMNFDQRSMHLNTEMGLIIDSPALAQQVAERFEALTQPANAYAPRLLGAPGSPPKLVWRTRENGKDVEYDQEPARDGRQRTRARFLSALPIDGEL